MPLLRAPSNLPLVPLVELAELGDGTLALFDQHRFRHVWTAGPGRVGS
jgi:hypothetical protein